MIALAKWSLHSLKFSVSTLGSRRGSIFLRAGELMRFGAGRMRSFSDRLSAWIQGFHISAVPSELKSCIEEVCVDHSGGFIII